METITHILARELNQSEQHVSNVVALLDEGNTIPFIARYRKELHWRSASSTCAIWRSGGRRSRGPSTARGS